MAENGSIGMFTRQKMIHAYKNGLSVAEIARQFKCHPDTVSNLLEIVRVRQRKVYGRKPVDDLED